MASFNFDGALAYAFGHSCFALFSGRKAVVDAALYFLIIIVLIYLTAEIPWI